MSDQGKDIGTGRMVLAFAPAVFLGAFLLFQVQPLMGKYILPWFGGSPEVWTVCMLVFQALLLAGYAYAHLSVSLFRPRVQAAVHAALLAVALLALPIIPASAWKPSPADNPTLRIALLLCASVGLPYFVLSATGPLLQGWFSRVSGGRPPYRLYSLSNAASLLALASYPFLVEPNLTRATQGRVWSVGLGAFAVVCGLCAAAVWRFGDELTAERHARQGQPRPGGQTPPAPPAGGPTGRPEAPTSGAKAGRGAPVAASGQGADEQAAPTIGRRLLWLALPAVASVELLAVTNKITQDVAVVPFLWVLPLSLYLLSFVICFDHQRWYRRGVFIVLFVLSLVATALVKASRESLSQRQFERPFAFINGIVEYAANLSGWQLIAMYSVVLLACCMVCHGELFRIRPHPRYLTGYYLMIAAGGAIGGFLVAVVAPLVFDSYVELPLGLLGCCLCIILAESGRALKRRRWLYVVMVAVTGLTAIYIDRRPRSPDQTAILSLRSFFGVLTLWDRSPDDPAKHCYILQHGTTLHGFQLVNPDMSAWPTSYYGRNSGVGLAMRLLEADRPRRIGAVGLGVGTIATYCRKGDLIRFYEINPQVIRLAREWFTYLSACKAPVEVVRGDARLSMENEPPQNYDLLVLDAFTSDAVPVHLLTREAFETCLRHLAPGGVIATHVSTHHLDLQALIWRQATSLGLETAWIVDSGDANQGEMTSDWMLLARDRRFFDTPEVVAASSLPKPEWAGVAPWTDDRVNLPQILH